MQLAIWPLKLSLAPSSGAWPEGGIDLSTVAGRTLPLGRQRQLEGQALPDEFRQERGEHTCMLATHRRIFCIRLT